MSRIEQKSTFLDAIRKDAESGRLVPARFQCPYVWGKPDVEALWTSLMKGYPVGSFLLWSPPHDVDAARLGRSRLGPICPEPGKLPDMILDGQNRLASFAWSLLSTDADLGRLAIDLDAISPLSDQERATWLSGEFLAADPVERSVRFRPVAEAEERLLVPAGVVAGSSSLNRFVRQWWDARGPIPEAHLDWLDRELQSRVLNARVTVTALVDMAPAEALEAFRHIARSGVPMSDADFSEAMAFALPEDGIASPAP
jgi:hypothetical protein